MDESICCMVLRVFTMQGFSQVSHCGLAYLVVLDFLFAGIVLSRVRIYTGG